MDAAQRRLRVVSAHFQPHVDATGGGGLDANPTAGEYAHVQGYSVVLPEKLQTGKWNVYRSAQSPLRLVNRFPGTPDVGTLHDNFVYAVETFTDCRYLGTRVSTNGTFGDYKWMTYGEASTSRTAIGSGLIYHGIPQGARVGLYFINRPEWIIIDHACAAYSYVSVPLYDTLGPDAVQFIVNHATVEAIFCVPQTLSTLLSFITQMPSVRLIVVVGGDDANTPSSTETTAVEIITYSRLQSQGRMSSQTYRPPRPEDVATICYTSGTTGTPKGAVLSHENLIANVAGSSLGIKFYPSDVYMSYLPLAHIYERANQIALLHYGVAIGFYQGDNLKLMDDLAALRPTVFASVPRLYNRIYSAITNAVKESGGLKERLFRTAYNAKRQAIINGRNPSPMWDKLVFNKIKARLGGRVRLMTSGASPLSADVMEFLRICFGGDVLEGYGMTETSCVITTMDFGDKLIGHVGSPNPSCEVKLVDVPEMNYTSEDQPYPRGEICVRGPAIFCGYYKDEVQTRDVIDDDGWLHTGDIGLWLPGGRLKIIDRRHIMVVVKSERVVNSYLRHATEDMLQNGRKEIRCPCRKCKLGGLLNPFTGDLLSHLLRYGFMDGYNSQWVSDDEDDEVHGAAAVGNDVQQDNSNDRIELQQDQLQQDQDQPYDPAHDHGEDVEQDVEEDHEDTGTPLTEVVRDPHLKELLLRKTTNSISAAREQSKLAQLEIDSKTPLYAGCGPGESRLRVALDVLQMKARYKWSDISVDASLQYWHDVLPEGNTCPKSCDEAKKVVCPFDLPHEKYHVCINDCYIYRKEDANKTICPVCSAARYKKGKKKAPRKVVWYFPLIPRLQRYFADRKEAELMRWHAKRRNKVLKDPNRSEKVILTHPSDASQWKAIDCEYPTFGAEARNIRLGVSTDGLNPFGNQSSTHSTWPVFVWMYNIPPWLCMKRKYIHMSMLIQGPKQPGNDINLYLKLLKDELETLWAEEGVNTWDAFGEQYFPMRAVLLCTVHDLLGYGYVAGQVCHGHNGCVRCMDDPTFMQLPKDPGSSKTVFVGHRRWLPNKDPWRRRGDLFNGEDELRGPPRKRCGEEIYNLLNDWKECPEPGKKQKAPKPLLDVWKTRSVFWDLPYWPILDTPHCLDLMHITKNVFESLFGTLLNMPERTKDGVKARNDLKYFGIRVDLQGGRPDDDDGDQSCDEETEGRKAKRVKRNDYYCPPSCFTLSPDEITKLMMCLLGVKVPSGYSGLISRFLDAQKQKFSGMKSHDCYVMMTQILPVAIRGIMDKHVRETLFGLCNFFDVISRKSITGKQISRLQEEIVVILCELEMYFPPSFFDICVHLLVHIVDDIIHLGPLFLHNMMPFERMNGVIKGYVRNRARPDGSIVQGFLTEECISFCTNHMDVEDPVGLPRNKHIGKLDGVGHKNGRREVHVDRACRRTDFNRANLVALQHIDMVDTWVEKHKSSIMKKYSEQGKRRTEGEIIREHNSTFLRWFKDVIVANPPPRDCAKNKLLYALAHGPAPNLATFQAYDINGFTFYTEEKDKTSDYQNSGVTMESYTGDKKLRYYGRIEEIWELNYSGEKVPMFRVRWARMSTVRKEDQYFTTMVIPEAGTSSSANVTAQNEPWVLAKHVSQCFFITDPARPSRVVVRRGKRNIIGMDGVVDEDEFDTFGDPNIDDDQEDDDDSHATYTTRRSRTTLPRHGLPFRRRSHNVGLNYATSTKKGKKIKH